MNKINQIAKEMAHLDVQSQSLQVPLDLVQLLFLGVKIARKTQKR